MRFARDLRLIPVVMIAAAALFILKASALLIEGGYTLIASRTAQAQGLGAGTAAADLAIPPPAALDDATPAPRGDRMRSWVRDLYPASEDITGSVAAAKPDANAPPKDQPAPQGAADKPASGTPAAMVAPLDMARPTAGERAVLESLQQRRQELESRAREMEVRDSLLKAAEKRIEQRLQELKDTEARLTGASAKRDEAEAAKFKSLVSMYENMKAKDAAKIFDRLDLRILVEVVNQINPRRMSDILGLMAPDAVERLTIEIANRSGAVNKLPQPVELPKIEGRPSKT